MNIEIMLAEDFEEFAAQRVASKDYWVLLCMNSEAIGLANVIEDRHYQGKKNDDFDWIVNAPPFLAVGFLKKTHMSPEQLRDAIREVGGTPAEASEYETHDVLIPFTEIIVDGEF